MPAGRVVDEPVDGAEFASAASLTKRRDLADVLEIERREMQRPGTRPLGLLDRRRQLFVHLPRHRDRAVALAYQTRGRSPGRGRGCRR